MAVVTEYFNQHPSMRSLKQIQAPFIWVQGNGTVSFGTGSFQDEEVGGLGATLALTADELMGLANAFARASASLKDAGENNGEPVTVQGQLLVAYESGRKVKLGDVDTKFEVNFGPA